MPHSGSSHASDDILSLASGADATFRRAAPNIASVNIMTGLKIRTKRAYEPPSREDGVRILVDRVWPRGISKKDAAIDHWAKDLAPSNELRKWFGHDPERWPEFLRRYEQELSGNGKALDQLLDEAGSGPITLVFAAKDEDRNNAVVLKEVLERRR
jgi:uncharacterized protein YeaO (DUF488 family)